MYKQKDLSGDFIYSWRLEGKERWKWGPFTLAAEFQQQLEGGDKIKTSTIHEMFHLAEIVLIFWLYKINFPNTNCNYRKYFRKLYSTKEHFAIIGRVNTADIIRFNSSEGSILALVTGWCPRGANSFFKHYWIFLITLCQYLLCKSFLVNPFLLHPRINSSETSHFPFSMLVYLRLLL